MSSFSLLLSTFSLTFDSLVTMCLCVDVFEFILLGFHGASWVCRLMFFIIFDGFLAIISSNILSAPFSLSCPFGIPIMSITSHDSTSNSPSDCGKHSGRGQGTLGV